MTEETLWGLSLALQILFAYIELSPDCKVLFLFFFNSVIVSLNWVPWSSKCLSMRTIIRFLPTTVRLRVLGWVWRRCASSLHATWHLRPVPSANSPWVAQ